MYLRLRSNSLLLPAAFLGGIAVVVLFIVYGTRSDYDRLNPAIGRLLPAGHCLCRSSVTFKCTTCLDSIGTISDSVIDTVWEFRYGRDDGNEGLTPDQCAHAFPGLFEDIKRAKDARGGKKIEKSDLDAMVVYKGMVRAMIYAGELYVIEVHCMGDDHRRKVVATLSSVYRAMTAVASRRALPNIEFFFTIEDMADDPNTPLWVLTRRIQDEMVWLMPDFGFWSWNIEGIGPFGQVLSEIAARDTDPDGGWSRKIPKLVWRGKPSFNFKLRRALLDVASGKPWADVRAIQWQSETSMRESFLSSVNYCDYMFLAHAEGRSYSAALKYRQACRSVVVIHKMQWIQHHHYLLVSNGTQQNFVEVERDFSDLESKIAYLLQHPDEARRIADNGVKVFRERYLTAAAEACYWRALIRGWAEVSFEPELYEMDELSGQARARGLRIESFM
ncbi:hypothetical protein MMC26_005910 [Xylographa opegraphella]|nr:hypothetical protein [Xylographa opegraphella]